MTSDYMHATGLHLIPDSFCELEKCITRKIITKKLLKHFCVCDESHMQRNLRVCLPICLWSQALQGTDCKSKTIKYVNQPCRLPQIPLKIAKDLKLASRPYFCRIF